MTTATIESVLVTLNGRAELSVKHANIRRDCEIALGLTTAKPETVAEARRRVGAAILEFEDSSGTPTWDFV